MREIRYCFGEMSNRSSRHNHEEANVAELPIRPQRAFKTGSDVLVDGGATASFFYGLLKPQSRDCCPLEKSLDPV